LDNTQERADKYSIETVKF